MNIVPLLVFLSLFLAACGVAMFLYSTRQRDHEHADRLALLPLQEDLPPREESPPGNQPEPCDD